MCRTVEAKFGNTEVRFHVWHPTTYITRLREPFPGKQGILRKRSR